LKTRGVQMKTSRSLIAAVVVSGLAITSGGSALAASKTTTVTKTTSKKVTFSNPKGNQKAPSASVNKKAPVASKGAGMGIGGAEKGGVEVLTSVLAKLVTAGTITQVQSDAIVKALADDKVAKDALRDAARVANEAARVAQKAKHEAVITGALGITAAELKTQLATGKSLAEIAGTKKDALIAALVAEKSADLDVAVTAGKITAAQATTAKANLVALVTAEISSKRSPMGGHLGGSMGGKGKGPKGNTGVAPQTAPAPTATTPAVPAVPAS
jgi:hypothetical protein